MEQRRQMRREYSRDLG
jgi:hypothetical protein